MASVRGTQAVAQTKTRAIDYDHDRVDGRVLSRHVVGDRIFDFNYDGLAEYGLLPDLVADLGNVGVPPRTIDTLFHSAEAYVAMWKRAESRAAALGKQRD